VRLGGCDDPVTRLQLPMARGGVSMVCEQIAIERNEAAKAKGTE
jgi:hypothetical protein